MVEIREQKLWCLGGYRSFGSYCERRWDISRDYALKLIRAAQVVDQLSPKGENGSPPPPNNERQARELVRLREDPHGLVAVWRALRKEHGDDLASEHVKHAVSRWLHANDHKNVQRAAQNHRGDDCRRYEVAPVPLSP